MKQLAQNPLFQQNPHCLGTFLERLASSTTGLPELPSESGVQAEEGGKNVIEAPADVPEPVVKKRAVVPDDVVANEHTEAAVESAKDDTHQAAYKSYWSKFKKPASHEALLGGQETPAVAPTVLSVEASPPWVDNQEGDPTLYPPASLPPTPRSLQQEMDAGHQDEEPKRSCQPKSEDVRAALKRKTTVDLAPQQQPGMTKVLMNLAGVMQPVWVPMCAESARAAGLQLAEQEAERSDAASTASTDAPGAPLANTEPTGHATAAAMSPQVVAAAPAETTPAETPAATPAGTAADDKNAANNANVEGLEKAVKSPAEQAQAALKNGYMRFHRSVTSHLNEIKHVFV